MNEKRFVELVNLYIDHEISREDLQELEDEVAHNAHRREIYHQYCRLQRASQSLYQDFGSRLAQTVDLKKYQMLARNSGSQVRLGLLYSSGALAAACLTVLAAVSIFQEAQWGSGGRSSSQEQSAAVVEVFEARSLDRDLSRRRQARLPSSADPFAAPVSFAAHSSPRRGDFFDSVRASARSGFQLTVSPSAWEEEFRGGSTAKVFRSTSSFEAPELASFQFQR